MRRQDYAVLAAQGAYQLANFPNLDRVESNRRFVQDNYLRVMHNRLRDADALLISL